MRKSLPRTSASETIDALHLHREANLAVRLGVSTATLRRWVRLGSFPKPVKIGPRASAWRNDEVTAWLDARERA
jgi:prophage regulatory protein